MRDAFNGSMDRPWHYEAYKESAESALVEHFEVVDRDGYADIWPSEGAER